MLTWSESQFVALSQSKSPTKKLWECYRAVV